MNIQAHLERLITYFGTQASAARAIGVAQPTLNAWLKGRHGVSPRSAIAIEKATKGDVKASSVCTDLIAYGVHETQDAA